MSKKSSLDFFDTAKMMPQVQALGPLLLAAVLAVAAGADECQLRNASQLGLPGF